MDFLLSFEYNAGLLALANDTLENHFLVCRRRCSEDYPSLLVKTFAAGWALRTAKEELRLFIDNQIAVVEPVEDNQIAVAEPEPMEDVNELVRFLLSCA
jgi:hypothetical protein